MKTLMADPALVDAIKQITEPTEIVDADGRSIAAIYPKRLSSKPLIPVEELERLAEKWPRELDVPTSELSIFEQDGALPR